MTRDTWTRGNRHHRDPDHCHACGGDIYTCTCPDQEGA